MGRITTGTPIEAALNASADDSFDEILRHGRLLDAKPSGREEIIALTESMLRIRDRAGQAVPLVPNRVQREYERQRGLRNIVLKARQMGISTWVTGRLFLKTITHPGTLTVQVAHTQEAAESLFRMVHRFVEHMPENILSDVLRTSRYNVRQIVFPMLDSEYRVESAADANAGRGLTITNLHCSEVARWPGDAAETLQGLRAAMPPDGELVIESTPMGAGGCFWRVWQEAEATGMVKHFFPWWWEPAYIGRAVCETTLNDVEQRLMQEHGLSHAQIGFRRQLLADFRGLAKQEYAEDPHTCFLSSGECVFERDALEACERRLRPPIAARLNGDLRIWYPPVPGRKYLVAVDPAGGGTEGDFSAAQVLELETGLQCTELACRMGGYELTLEIVKLAEEYNRALVIVERNNHGSGILAYLGGVCRYPRIYEQHGQQGWLTTQLTRPEMIGKLGAALLANTGMFSSERLLRECRTFVRHRNGKLAAQYGEHDDCVMAMAMALAVRSELQIAS